MPGRAEAIDEDLPGRIGFQGTGITDCQHRDIERHERYISLGFHRLVQL